MGLKKIIQQISSICAFVNLHTGTLLIMLAIRSLYWIQSSNFFSVIANSFNASPTGVGAARNDPPNISIAYNVESRRDKFALSEGHVHTEMIGAFQKIGNCQENKRRYGRCIGTKLTGKLRDGENRANIVAAKESAILTWALPGSLLDVSIRSRLRAELPRVVVVVHEYRFGRSCLRSEVPSFRLIDRNFCLMHEMGRMSQVFLKAIRALSRISWPRLHVEAIIIKLFRHTYTTTVLVFWYIPTAACNVGNDLWLIYRHQVNI